MAKLTVDLDRSQMRQLMRLSIQTHKPLWQILSEIVRDGISKRWVKRKKVRRAG